MFLFLTWMDSFDLDQTTLVVVYVADERAPFSAGRDKAAQNVDIIVQRSVHRQLNIQQIWKAWHCSLHTSGGTAPGSLLMGSNTSTSTSGGTTSTRLSANGVELSVFKSAPSRFPVSSTCFMCLPPRLQDTDNCRHVSALAKMGKVFYCIRWI